MSRSPQTISTHALTWRATRKPVKHHMACAPFLPTPSHGGRRAGSAYCSRCHFGISTHALTWRATLTFYCNRFAPLISTHALTWRATNLAHCPCAWTPISTHALTWRATCKSVPLHVSGQQFLPTPSHGGRPVQSITLPTLPGFLPTPSHGGRPGADKAR